MELIPIFLGGFFFTGCAFCGLFVAALAKGKNRWRGLYIGAVGLIGLLPLLMVLPPPFPSLQSVSGTYEGNFGGGEVTFVLRPDQTYDQHFVSNVGKVYDNHGTWRLNKGDVGVGVHFNHFLETVGDWGEPQTPQVVESRDGILYLVRADICFNEDDDITIHRTER